MIATCVKYLPCHIANYMTTVCIFCSARNHSKMLVNMFILYWNTTKATQVCSLYFRSSTFIFMFQRSQGVKYRTKLFFYRGNYAPIYPNFNVVNVESLLVSDPVDNTACFSDSQYRDMYTGGSVHSLIILLISHKVRHFSKRLWTFALCTMH